MRIVILNIYSGLVNRGAETISTALAIEWNNMGHDIHVVSGGQVFNSALNHHYISGVHNLNTEAPGISKKLLSFVGYPNDYEKMLTNFTSKSLDVIQSLTPDVILALNGSFQSKILSNSAWHNRSFAVLHGQSETRFWKLGGQENLRILNTRLAGYIVINPQLYAWAIKRFPNKKIKLIPNGVERRFFDSSSSLKKNKSILCVAGLQKFKQIDLLIKAFSLLPNEISLTILGEGPEKEKLNTLINKLNLSNRVIITTCSHDEIINYYNQASIFSLPSTQQEAFGVSYLEAMASGLPVVAPDDELRRFIVANAGILTDVTNPKIYAQGLLEALNTDWRDLPHTQARKFAWDSIAKDYLNFFQN